MSEAAAAMPVALGMTLFNKARYLPEAIESLLGQTDRDFVLALLDDGSTDETERIAREYARRDARVRYARHESRRGMVTAWRAAAALARRECPSAAYFAWTSDHDRWDRAWLARLRRELDAHPDVVLAYPITRRIGANGEELEKGPRHFDTFGVTSPDERWRRFCREGVGAGDMVYGLMRVDALDRAGTFRPVLRPDRLLIAELSLIGQFRQVDEVLWFRRETGVGASVDRQRATLFVAGEEPKGFWLPAWAQHSTALWNAHRAPLGPVRLARMLALYQVSYGARHVRKTELSHRFGRSVDNAHWVKKVIKRTYHRAVYEALVGGRALWGRTRRAGRRVVYETLMLTHRAGLRGTPKERRTR